MKQGEAPTSRLISSKENLLHAINLLYALEAKTEMDVT